MNKDQHLQDLTEIREMMTRSSRFMSLSGISGVLAGLLALGGAYLAYVIVYQGQHFMTYRKAVVTFDNLLHLVLIAASILILSVGSGIYFSYRKAKRTNESFWNDQARRVLINLLIPLVTGGFLCLMLLSRGYVGILPPLTLIFYGLGLVNASKYTMTEIRSLGILEILVGLIAMEFIGYGLIFWSIGFGVLHIVYGIIMYLKYER